MSHFVKHFETETRKTIVVYFIEKYSVPWVKQTLILSFPFHLLHYFHYYATNYSPFKFDCWSNRIKPNYLYIPLCVTEAVIWMSNSEKRPRALWMNEKANKIIRLLKRFNFLLLPVWNFNEAERNNVVENWVKLSMHKSGGALFKCVMTDVYCTETCAVWLLFHFDNCIQIFCTLRIVISFGKLWVVTYV